MQLFGHTFWPKPSNHLVGAQHDDACKLLKFGLPSLQQHLSRYSDANTFEFTMKLMSSLRFDVLHAQRYSDFLFCLRSCDLRHTLHLFSSRFWLCVCVCVPQKVAGEVVLAAVAAKVPLRLLFQHSNQLLSNR